VIRVINCKLQLAGFVATVQIEAELQATRLSDYSAYAPVGHRHYFEPHDSLASRKFDCRRPRHWSSAVEYIYIQTGPRQAGDRLSRGV
jgi:hypothetical protein